MSRMVFSHDGTLSWPVDLQASELAGSAAQAQAYVDSLLQGALSSRVIPAALHASMVGSASACSLLSQAAAGLQRTQTGTLLIKSASLLLNMPLGTQHQCHPASCWQQAKGCGLVFAALSGWVRPPTLLSCSLANACLMLDDDLACRSS